MKDLVGKTAVVTGAASGMGYAFAGAFLANGMRVVLADVEESALSDAADSLSAGEGDVLAVCTDVSDYGAVSALRDAALERFGQVHVLCNNAGVGGVRGDISQLEMMDWEWVLGVNLWGVIHGCRAFLPHIIEHGDGHIVNTASVAGHLSLPFMGPYNVAKHGVVTLSETLRHELEHRGSSVGVSVLCPGFVATRLIDADRNRPERLRRPLAEAQSEDSDRLEQERQAAREIMATKKPPGDVAELVVSAIRDGQFWVFTDHQFDEAIAMRHRSIETRDNPGKSPTLLDFMLR